MSNVAVVFYSSLAESARVAPDLWPAYVREIGAQSSYSESPYVWSVMTVDDYKTYVEDHLGDYDSWIASHPADPSTPVIHSINAAATFGRQLRTEFSAHNVLTGITTEQVAELCTMLYKLNLMLESGSLQTALTEIDALPTDQCPFWTVDEKNLFTTRITNYLQGLA